MRAPRTALSALLLVTLAGLLALSAPAWPDDWDGIGFLESVSRFDLDHFAPHPPGYPVYVALLRVASVLARRPIWAADLVAVASGVATMAFLGAAAARALGSGARATWLAAFVAVTPLTWRAFSGVGSEAPALALVSAAIAGATLAPARAARWIGVAAGLGLGVRLSWAPLFLVLPALAPRGVRGRTASIAALATLAWVAPFVAVVGARHLFALATVHASGHFHSWGGTALTDPGPSRYRDLARDLLVDGLGMDGDLLGLGIAAAALALAVLGFRAWKQRGWIHARYALLLAPYALWIALGQNLHQQPRHALPLVVALSCLLGISATTSPRARAVGALLALALAVRTAGDAWARRTIPPPGAQLVDLARGLPESPDVAVFGGASSRFFELAPAVATAQAAGTLGDVRLALGRFAALPRRVLVTGEIGGLPTSREPLAALAVLCRPPRIDRRQPCLQVFDYRAPFLRQP